MNKAKRCLYCVFCVVVPLLGLNCGNNSDKTIKYHFDPKAYNELMTHAKIVDSAEYQLEQKRKIEETGCSALDKKELKWLEKFISRYPNSTSAFTARLRMASEFWISGIERRSEAGKIYQEVITSAPKDSWQRVYALSYMGEANFGDPTTTGSKDVVTGKIKYIIDHFEEVKKLDKVTDEEYWQFVKGGDYQDPTINKRLVLYAFSAADLLGLANLYERLGKLQHPGKYFPGGIPPKSLEVIRRIIKEYPGTDEAQQAVYRLSHVLKSKRGSAHRKEWYRRHGSLYAPDDDTIKTSAELRKLEREWRKAYEQERKERYEKKKQRYAQFEKEKRIYLGILPDDEIWMQIIDLNRFRRREWPECVVYEFPKEDHLKIVELIESSYNNGPKRIKCDFNHVLRIASVDKSAEAIIKVCDCPKGHCEWQTPFTLDPLPEDEVYEWFWGTKVRVSCFENPQLASIIKERLKFK